MTLNPLLEDAPFFPEYQRYDYNCDVFVVDVVGGIVWFGIDSHIWLWARLEIHPSLTRDSATMKYIILHKYISERGNN